MQIQVIALELDGITADDYLTWFRDPDRDRDERLESFSFGSEAFGDRLVAVLRWRGDAPSAALAVAALGLQLTPHVVAIRSHVDVAPRVAQPAELAAVA